MNYSYIQISNTQLILTVILVLITGLISTFLKLGMLKSLLWGTVRAFLQLTLIGYALTFIFAINKLYIILPILLLQCFIAAREASKRINKVPESPMGISFLALAASSFIVGLIVVMLIISPQPLYSARVMIPIFGMILGNSMNGIALSLDRMLAEINSHIDQVEQLLCLGASPWEAVKTHAQTALKAGMVPSINALMVVGLVSLPGMMTGQILAGMNPQSAVRYQFVVMVMMTAAVAIGCLLIVGLSYKKVFTAEMAIVESMRRN